MKQCFEIKLPQEDICQKLLQSDGELSGYHHKFEIENRVSDEILLVLKYSLRLKAERLFRPQVRLRLVSETIDTTIIYVDSPSRLWWGFWVTFFSTLYILPIINTPQLPYFITYLTFLVVGTWTARQMNWANGRFLYQILWQIFDDKQLMWIGHPSHNPQDTKVLFNRIIPFQIESNHPTDTIIQNLRTIPEVPKIGKSSKLKVIQKSNRIVILHYVKVRSHYWLRHHVDVNIISLNGIIQLHGRTVIETDSQTQASTASIFITIILSLFWVYLGLNIVIAILMLMVLFTAISWWRDASKTQDKLLEHILNTVN